MVALGAAQQHLRHLGPRLDVAQCLEHLAGSRLDVLDHFFQQRVVVVGQHLHQRRPHLGAALGDAVGQRNLFRCGAAPVLIGALADHIDIAGDRLAIANRHLAQYQPAAGEVLQRRHGVAHLAAEGIDTVDEHHGRQADLFHPTQQRGHGGRADRVGVAHQHRDVGHRQRGFGLVRHFHRTGAIDQRPRFVEIGAMGNTGRAARSGTPTGGSSGGGDQRIEQRRLAAAVGTDKGHGAWPGQCVWHERPPGPV